MDILLGNNKTVTRRRTFPGEVMWPRPAAAAQAAVSAVEMPGKLTDTLAVIRYFAWEMWDNQ